MLIFKSITDNICQPFVNMKIIIKIGGHDFLKSIDHKSFIADNVDQIISTPF